ncbi:hypothetical protein SAMN06295924_1199 [Rathayibacter rathayi NCPPB 2980 = VKM Ac-1601]|nr:hypothetical protein C5C47_10255 [Rathayibacter rathayi]PPG95123.1 hypothetical protein C5C00_10925 [Rathayibacter rathayi]TWD69007.1 hypothetical protein FB469_0716 [Rathayibacter rathayi]SOE05933.1 hypothetical protein SAMN06295924_1199 [Rathayibacter rathayi NCPPB 2980 = VKM Ac-1601]
MVFTGPINRTHASLIGGAVLEMALTADRIAADAWRNAPTEGFAAGLHESRSGHWLSGNTMTLLTPSRSAMGVNCGSKGRPTTT